LFRAATEINAVVQVPVDDETGEAGPEKPGQPEPDNGPGRPGKPVFVLFTENTGFKG